MRYLFTFALAATLFALATTATAQFGEEAPKGGPKLDKSLTQKLRVGITVSAVGGPVRGIYGTVPVPTEWPEQRVEIASEDLSAGVQKVQFRELGGGARQMIIRIPNIPANEEVEATVTFEITRSSQLPPDDTGGLKIPKKVGRDASIYLGAGPYIETRHPKIKAFAKETGAGLEGWAKVEAIYDAVRDKVKYTSGPLKGALRALNDGEGDAEDLACLFIAACRAAGVPARTVWVDKHVYAEFYLIDQQEQGYWFPCQIAGSRNFGGYADHNAILQKGDNFKDPDRPKDKLRFVNEFVKGAAAKGSGKPRVKFIRQTVAN